MASKKKINGQFDFATFGNDMLHKRSQESVTFAQLEQETGIPASSLYNAESGKKVKFEHIITICNWLGKPMQDYLTL